MKNPFALFDLPVSFDISLDELNVRYLALQKNLHPDNFVTANAATQRHAMQQALDVNDALKVLKDPILRAEAIIALQTGETTDLEQKSTRDVAFLMEQLAWREELEQIDTAQDEQALERFSSRVSEERTAMLAALGKSLNLQDWAQAAQYCDKLRFIKKLSDEVERVEERLFEC